MQEALRITFPDEAQESLADGRLCRSAPFQKKRAFMEFVAYLAAQAGHAERIYFGSLVAKIPCRDPVKPAQQAAPFVGLSGGRQKFGLGSSWAPGKQEAWSYKLGGRCNPPELSNHPLVVLQCLTCMKKLSGRQKFPPCG